MERWLAENNHLPVHKERSSTSRKNMSPGHYMDMDAHNMDMLGLKQQKM